MLRLPGPNAPLQGPPYAVPEVWMTALQLFENCDGPQVGRRLQHRRELCVPDSGERIGATAPPRLPFLRWQAGVIVQTATGGGAEPGLGGGHVGRMGAVEIHVQSRLVIGDVFAGQGRALESLSKKPRAQPAFTTIARRDPRGDHAAAGSVTSVGLRPASVIDPAASP